MAPVRVQVPCIPLGRDLHGATLRWNRDVTARLAGFDSQASRMRPFKVIGFTGSREGMTPAQERAVRILLECYRKHGGAEWFVHGDCVGADAAAHALAVAEGLKTAALPGNIPKLRAYCQADVVDEPLEPLVRNRKLVRKADVVIACPKTAAETRRGGTWYTIRHARETETPLLVCLPEGPVRVECLRYWE